MKIDIVGGGPGGLYAAILLKKFEPSREIAVYDRNPPDATYGWGVVFSDETLGFLEDADPETYAAVAAAFVRWEAIDIHYRGQRIRSGGHAFSGLSRKRLLGILQDRCAGLGVRLQYRHEIDGEPRADLVIAADGLNSRLREAHADVFRPSLDVHHTKYIWLGVGFRFDAFTFSFRDTAHGMFQVHAYPFDESMSTFIVECNESTWKRAGLDSCDEAGSLRFCEDLFADVLSGRPLLSNRSTWLNFTTLRNETWRCANLVLLGDAAHTAHFSVGSGTKLAMEDAIALAASLAKYPHDLQSALVEYEELRHPYVERTQAAARESSFWFENTGRYGRFEPIQFAFSLLTRSKRVTYENLRLRDSDFADTVDVWFAGLEDRVAHVGGNSVAPPPLKTALALAGVTFRNRLVGAINTDSGIDGDPGSSVSRAVETLTSTRGLVLAPDVAVSADARITTRSSGLYTDVHEETWRSLVDTVHGSSDTRIGIQLVHAGRRGATRPRAEGVDIPLREGAWPLISASPIRYTRGSAQPREMTEADVDALADTFREAALRATRAGFDLLDLHFGHGYALGSFISPLSNRRTDLYGGALECRLRFPLRVLAAVRGVWPEDRPLSVAFSVTDWAPDGLTDDEALISARAFHGAGCDLIHVLTGQTVAHANPVYGRAWQSSFADRIRNDAGVRVMVGGGITTADEVNTLLAAGRADLCEVSESWSDAPSPSAVPPQVTRTLSRT